MTQMQLKHLELQETARANRAREDENYRSNFARETETHRSNVVDENERARSNRANESLKGEANDVAMKSAIVGGVSRMGAKVIDKVVPNIGSSFLKAFAK